LSRFVLFRPRPRTKLTIAYKQNASHEIRTMKFEPFSIVAFEAAGQKFTDNFRIPARINRAKIHDI